MAETRPPRLAVFDCDGTLVDSQHGIVACMAAAFAAERLVPPTADAVRGVIGLPLEHCMARLAPAEEAVRHQRLTEHYKRHFFTLRQEAGFHEPLFEGALDALAALESAGFMLGIATGKARRGLLAVLERHGLGDRFVTLQTSDLAPGKPHPAMLQRAMQETGLGPADTVMIGDTSFDMQMARAAGVYAVGVAWGYHATEELITSGAHVLIDRFVDLPRAVNSFEWRTPCA